MTWFKRWLCSSNSQLDNMASSIDSLREIVVANENGFQKGFRRLSMAQKQQSETLELLLKESSALKEESSALAKETSSLKFTLAKHQGVAISYEQALQALDNLTKIELVANNTPTHQNILMPLITRAIDDLLSLYKLEKIAEVGKLYPAQACEVVGAVEQAQYPPGTVTEILQQGYQTRQGDLVRNAKVIVSNAPPSTTKKLEGTENAN